MKSVRFWAVGASIMGASFALFAQVPPPHPPPPVPSSLKSVSVPKPDLSAYVANQAALIQLGKAFFWDMQMGSDGVQSCASCHFHAGADHRIKNALNPGTNANPPMTSFVAKTFNDTMLPGDYPFHRFSNPADRSSSVVFDQPARTGSQGVFLFRFLSVIPGSAVDNGTIQFDDIFQIGGANIRRVEPRNTPTTINAVFNHRNFWDGRASFNFNGRSPFGLADTNAVILVGSTSFTPTHIAIPYSSLASQAVGPMLSNFEMSYDMRLWPNLGKKMLHPAIKPLGKQAVSTSDSRLGALADPSGKGLATTYKALVQTAFQSQYWNNTSQFVNIDANGNPIIKSGSPVLTVDFTQMEFNFPFFFGLAVQAYEQTLVSDDTKFDKVKDTTPTATLTADESAGLDLFMDKGKCIACHQGAEFTSATVSHVFNVANDSGVVERMLMDDNTAALYDVGFYNTTVRPDANDIGLGGTDPFGNPLSISRLAKQNSPLISGFGFPIVIQNFDVNPGVPISSTERDAVNGSFKTPTLRNVELTGPYMHNGGESTLEDVMAFYNRGGNFSNPEKHPDITSLGLTATEQAQLVAFMKTLTDDRVRREKAPFDHPQIFVPNGHPSNPDGSLVLGSNAKGRDVLCEIPVVGAAGGQALQTFTQQLNNVTSDAYGPLAHVLSNANCVVQPPPSDTIAPVMTFKGVSSGRTTIAAQDSQSGLSSIFVTTAQNANVKVPEITGQTSLVNVTYTKIDSTQSSTVALQATDVDGNVSIFDPWDLLVSRTTGKPEVITSLCTKEDTIALPALYNCDPTIIGRGVGAPRHYPLMEHLVLIENGGHKAADGTIDVEGPGLTNLRIIVNGVKFQVAGLKDGEEVKLDVQSAMKGNSNTFAVEALGKPGGHALVMFYGPK